jgi:hypothetical protein
LEVPAPGKLLGKRVGAVGLDARDHPGGLALAEKVPGLGRVLGEVDDDEVGADGEQAGEDAFDLFMSEKKHK